MSTEIKNGEKVTRGLCQECAEKMGITPNGSLPPMIHRVEIDSNGLEDLGKEMGGIFESLFSDFPFMEPPSKERVPAAIGANGNGGGAATRVRPQRQRKKTALDAFATNLTKKAANGEIDRVIGRAQEIERVMQILNRRTKNNPCLIGEPGVGKTAIAEGLAVKIAEKTVPPKLLNKEIFLLDMTAVVAGTQFRGQFEQRMKSIIDEAKEQRNVILVIDEVHSLIGAGDAEGAMNAANILKPALARGEIQVIGATTLAEYRKHIEKDSALERRFQPILVKEPTEEETIEIIKGIRGYYEKYHGVKIEDAVIKLAVTLSKRYINDRFLPDKAIDVIDEAGARINLNNQTFWELAKLRNDLLNLQSEKENAVAADSIEDYQKAAEIKIKECNLIEKIAKLEKQCANVHITAQDVAHVIELWTGVPNQKITEFEANELMSLEGRLAKNVIGQQEAVKAVAEAVRINRTGVSIKKRPTSFIFVGPTGVGKTELVRQLAIELFGSQDNLIRLDMSEYMEKHSVSKLTGSPPGYIGYDEAGQLTEKVRTNPYSVLLLDEIEKAHHDIFNILLQVLDEGRITDSKGRTIDFSNTVIVMTSNAGSTSKDGSYGFGKTAESTAKTKTDLALKEIFRPEFLNRIDEVIVFNQLEKKELHLIAELMLRDLEKGLKEKEIAVTWGKNLIEHIAQKGYDPKYGARPMRRVIKKEIESVISHKLLNGKIKESTAITVEFADEEVRIEVQ